MMNSEKVKAANKKKINFITTTGRRKEAVARVRLWLEKNGIIFINEKPIEEVFKSPLQKKIYEEPFRVVDRLGQFSASIKLRGGGKSAQLGAIVHGVSRALALFESETFRPALSKYKFLTRDSREKESRKYGHAGKARKRKQSPKR